MITPSFALTATERVLPRMALNFTTATLDPRVTFTRTGDTATVTNSSGVIAAINANLPRFDFDPTTLICKGLLIEETRTNLLVNSLLNGTSLSTQLITTTAVPHTLTFYGTGQIVLTGTSSATVVGIGAYPARQTLTFTPTVGVLTLTVTGTVQYAQLELGTFATSFIPTDATSKTRNADVATMTGTNFSDWYNQTGSTMVCSYVSNLAINTGTLVGYAWTIADGTSITTSSLILLQARSRSNSISVFYSTTGGGLDASVSLFSGSDDGNVAVSFNPAQNCSGCVNGGTTLTAASAQQAMTATHLFIGASNENTGSINGTIKNIYYYPQRLTSAELRAFSK